MLYYNFIVCIMVCAFLALLNMIYDQDWQYIILPIGILIWGFFKFFDDNDRNYLKSKGIDPDDYSILDDLFGRSYNNDFYNNRPIRHNNTITWDNENYSSHHSRIEDTFDSELYSDTTHYSRYQPRNWQDPRYKGMINKCKRNFKITVENHEEKPKRTVFFSPHYSGT